MDKKTKKRLAVLRERVQRVRQQISAEVKQTDDEALVMELKVELEKLTREIEPLSQR